MLGSLCILHRRDVASLAPLCLLRKPLVSVLVLLSLLVSGHGWPCSRIPVRGNGSRSRLSSFLFSLLRLLLTPATCPEYSSFKNCSEHRPAHMLRLFQEPSPCLPTIIRSAVGDNTGEGPLYTGTRKEFMQFPPKGGPPGL